MCTLFSQHTQTAETTEPLRCAISREGFCHAPTCCKHAEVTIHLSQNITCCCRALVYSESPSVEEKLQTSQGVGGRGGYFRVSADGPGELIAPVFTKAESRLIASFELLLVPRSLQDNHCIVLKMRVLLAANGS